MLGEDPLDINQGLKFVFLGKDATHKMRQEKKKVRYVFDGEEEKNAPVAPAEKLIKENDSAREPGD